MHAFSRRLPFSRDLAARNVLVSADGNVVKVSDYGLSRVTTINPEHADAYYRTSSSLSLSFDTLLKDALPVCMTSQCVTMALWLGISTNRPMPLRWLAPEVLQSKKCTQASDVYSFGMTMYEVMSRGQMPFDELEDKQVIEVLMAALRRLESEQRPLVLIPPASAPAKMREVYKRCVDIRATARPDFRTIAELLSPYSAAEPLLVLDAADTEESHL